ncbi:hypothetical protein NRIC_14780 [Enterococcus florum]|uniref:N-acetyltransferase domain-containing protein n=1 Tax=Enterococcus florum TaxID=2480627 RepID=A0A4P5P6P2_9ENTE|nr:hypothetical protein [Enterococcus florum]GCF93587.1 hypothetical protein NRIC_14780 [Enterococcus florum]
MELCPIGTNEVGSKRLLFRRFILKDNLSIRTNWAGDEEIQKLYSEPAYKTEEANDFLKKVIEHYQSEQ